MSHLMLYTFVILVEFLKNQWKNLQDNARHCLPEKRRDMSKSGAAAPSQPKCKYFNKLQFVHDKVLNKESSSNINIAIRPSVNGPNSLFIW